MMANVETRRDENTFLRSGCNAYEHIFYEEQQDTTGLFYRDLGARWLHRTTAGGGHRKRKTFERGVGGFLRGAPLNIYPDWRRRAGNAVRRDRTDRTRQADRRDRGRAVHGVDRSMPTMDSGNSATRTHGKRIREHTRSGRVVPGGSNLGAHAHGR